MKPTFDENENYKAEKSILEKAFKEFASGCEFTVEERETLEKLDEILKNADIIVSKDGSSATIATAIDVTKVGAYPSKQSDNSNKNADAKILEEAFKQLIKGKDHLNNEDIELIEKLDSVLKEADIVVGENANDYTTIQSNGVVHSTNSGRSR